VIAKSSTRLTRGSVVLAGLLAVSCGGGGSANEGTPSATRSVAPTALPPTAIWIVDLEYEDGRFSTFLSRLDSGTLQPRGRRASVGEFHDTWSLSPDRRYVALGTGGQGRGITIYDLARMKRVRAVRTGIAAQGLAWPTPTRLIAILQSNRLAVVDPATGRVLREHSLPRDQTACTSAPTAKSSLAVAGGLLVLLRGRRGAASTLLRVDAEGSVRHTTLPVGAAWGCGRAGLAVDGAGTRAFVISRTSIVAQVELSTMTASYHRVAGTRLRDAQPREVSWLDDRHLVASGRDAVGRSAGVTIIDTATWTNRMIDPGAGMARPAGGLVLTYDGDRVAVPRGRGRGLSGYRAAGDRAFHVLRGSQVNAVEHADGRAFAVSERIVRAVDLATGRLVGQRAVPAARVSLTLLG
jgi:hypothetical protein